METEAENNGSSQQSDLDKVLEKINEIGKKSADGDYIYRGEPECYDKVSSGLYRFCCEYLHTEEVYFNMEGLQEVALEGVKTHIGKIVDIDETDNSGVLAELQHFGLDTNLIGFTEDYLIALFFACNGSHEAGGRVILLKKLSDDYAIETLGRSIHRFESQKSVCVASPTGFVEPDNLVTIPADLKFPIQRLRTWKSTIGYLLQPFITTRTNLSDGVPLGSFIKVLPISVKQMNQKLARKKIDMTRTRLDIIPKP